nr:leukocyte elastase inhibitor-like [Penaeus vannamei]
MVLTNAVYFKGFWKYPFKPQRTHKDKFFVTPEDYVQVDMMTQTGRFKYVDSEKLHAQVLEMPYRGDAVSMVVLLPRMGEPRRWTVRGCLEQRHRKRDRPNEAQVPNTRKAIRRKTARNFIVIFLLFNDKAGFWSILYLGHDLGGLGFEGRPGELDYWESFGNVI